MFIVTVPGSRLREDDILEDFFLKNSAAIVIFVAVMSLFAPAWSLIKIPRGYELFFPPTCPFPSFQLMFTAGILGAAISFIAMTIKKIIVGLNISHRRELGYVLSGAVIAMLAECLLYIYRPSLDAIGSSLSGTHDVLSLSQQVISLCVVLFPLFAIEAIDWFILPNLLVKSRKIKLHAFNLVLGGLLGFFMFMVYLTIPFYSGYVGCAYLKKVESAHE